MEFKILAEKREKKEKLNKDFIPAVAYSKGSEALSLKIRKNEFEKIFSFAGESNLIDLMIEDKGTKVLVKDVQRHALNHSIVHVDFYQVDMNEKVVAEVKLNYIGESKAVKELGGMLNKELDSLEVECLPKDLVNAIDVDVSVLVSFDDAIRVSDLKLPKGVVATADAEEMVASVKESKITEEAPVEVKAEEEKKEEKPKA